MPIAESCYKEIYLDKKLHVVLVNPPSLDGKGMIREGRCTQKENVWTTAWAPVSLATCTAVLLEAGFSSTLYDCPADGIGVERFKQLLQQEKPDMAVFSTATVSIAHDLKIAALCREILPHVKTAALGTHVSTLPDETLRAEPALDAVVRGEPEYTLRELAQTLSQNGSFTKDVQGVTYRANEEIIQNPTRPFIANLDELPFPAWQFIEPQNYRLPITREPYLLVNSGRGCPYPCNFCTAPVYNGKRVRSKSPQRTVDEMQWVHKNFGVNHIMFWSDGFTLDENFARETCEEILRRNFKINWIANSRVDDVDFELLKLMKRAGCWILGYGIDSGSQETLDKVGKKFTLAQARDAVKWARKAGLTTCGFFIMGFPHENVNHLKETIKFAKSVELDFAQFLCAVPLPGTRLYEEAMIGNYMTVKDWNTFEFSHSIMKYNGISPEVITHYRKKAYLEFYLRPKVIFRILRRIQGLSGVSKFADTLKSFLGFVRPLDSVPSFFKTLGLRTAKALNIF